MASVSKIAHSRHHHHSRPAAEIPRTQSGRKHLAVYARQLALEPHLQILRRYRRSLLLRLEYAPRPALENHVHRITPVGSWVLINEMWYKLRYANIHRAITLWDSNTVLRPSICSMRLLHRLCDGTSRAAEKQNQRSIA